MCLAGEEQPGGSAVGAGGAAVTVPEVVVTGARLGLNMEAFALVDWGEVAKHAAFAVAGGALGGVLKGAIGAGAAAGAGAIEDQIDIEDLFEIKNDVILIPGMYPSLILH